MTTATLPLEFLYQRGPRVRRAESEVLAAEADAAGERQRVMLEAARAFYRTALAQVEFEATSDVAGWLDTVVTYNRRRVKEGVAAEADLIRSELERDRATAEATMQEADLVRASADLAAFLGDTVSALSGPVAFDAVPLALPGAPTIPVALTASRPDTPAAAGVPWRPLDDTARSALVDRALAGRPEVRAARERFAAAGAGVSAERSMLLRQLGATVGTKQSAGSTSLVAGVSVPVPLFDQNRGEVARATAEREAAAFELAAQERAVRAEVSGAYEAARLLTARATALASGPPSQGYLARADEARRIALGAYQEGAVPLLQVIDAARAWAEARIAFYRTLFAQHESVLALLAAEGADVASARPMDTATNSSSNNPTR